MRTKKEIEAKLADVESDERLGYEPANVFVNAPLALIQMDLEARQSVLKWVLEEEGS